jgi:hypothetical protein
VPKRPQGRKAPGDAAGNPVKPGSVVRDGKEPEELEAERIKRAAAELGSRGGKARAARMPPERRTEIARTAAAKRWNKPPRAE